MRWINAEQKVTVSIYDEEHEEYIDKTMTIEEMLDAYTNEGCPIIYASQKPIIEKIRTDIQKLRNCSCSCSDGIIDDVEDILDRYKAEEEEG